MQRSRGIGIGGFELGFAVLHGAFLPFSLPIRSLTSQALILAWTGVFRSETPEVRQSAV
jgi:hypothetical protein